MRKFGKNYIFEEIVNRYIKTFPDEKINATILSYGFKNDKTENTTNMFFCFDSDHELIGFAIYYESKKILRLYNCEGEDVGIEFDMIFVPSNKGKIIKKFKL